MSFRNLARTVVLVCRVYEQGNDGSRGRQLAQELQSFFCQFGSKQGYACDVGSWSAEALDETNLDWIDTYNETIGIVVGSLMLAAVPAAAHGADMNAGGKLLET